MAVLRRVIFSDFRRLMRGLRDILVFDKYEQQNEILAAEGILFSKLISAVIEIIMPFHVNFC